MSNINFRHIIRIYFSLLHQVPVLLLLFCQIYNLVKGFAMSTVLHHFFLLAFNLSHLLLNIGHLIIQGIILNVKVALSTTYQFKESTSYVLIRISHLLKILRHVIIQTMNKLRNSLSLTFLGKNLQFIEVLSSQTSLLLNTIRESTTLLLAFIVQGKTTNTVSNILLQRIRLSVIEVYCSSHLIIDSIKLAHITILDGILHLDGTLLGRSQILHYLGSSLHILLSVECFQLISLGLQLLGRFCKISLSSLQLGLGRVQFLNLLWLQVYLPIHVAIKHLINTINLTLHLIRLNAIDTLTL